MQRAALPEQRLQWLIDRAEIAECLVNYAQSILIEGDHARTHSHDFATHISEGTTVKRQGGGWYDCELRRTDRGWRFTRVRSTTAWRTGEPLELH